MRKAEEKPYCLSVGSQLLALGSLGHGIGRDGENRTTERDGERD